MYKQISALGLCSTVIVTVGTGKETLLSSSQFSFGQFRVASRALHRVTFFSILVLSFSPVLCVCIQVKDYRMRARFLTFCYSVPHMPPDLGLEFTYTLLFLACFFVLVLFTVLDDFSFSGSNEFNRFGTSIGLTSIFFGR